MDSVTHENVLQRHVDLLGCHVCDRVTGFSGVVTSVGFDLYGCVQAIVQPKATGEDLKDSRWFDVNRLEVTGADRAMPVPSFAHLLSTDGVHEKGPAEKPRR